MEIVLHGLQRKTLTVSDDAVNIEKKGLLSAKRHRTILIRNITSVEVKKPGALSGFIQFSIAGGAVRDGSFKPTGGAFDAAQDENSVLFIGQDNYQVALQVKAYVELWSSKEQRPTPQPARSVADEIRALKALVDEGLLTAEEFDAKKKQLLGI